MTNTKRTLFSVAAIAGVFIATLSASANANVIYESASYTGVDTGEYILTSNNVMGAAFTLDSKTNITGIGAQFGGYPSGTIFGAIVPLASQSAFPDISSDQLASLALGYVVFAVPSGTQDYLAPLALELNPGSYGVVFGSGQFGATGWAGLGDLNDPVGNPNLFRSFFSTDWDSFDDTGVRFFVEGTAVPEPAAILTLSLGLGAVGGMRRLKRPA